jgi:two-component system, LytTR family, response regulator
VLRSGGRIVFVLRDDVEWVEAAGNYVRFHAANGTIQIRDRMSAVEERLGDGFARIHRSTVVNLRLVVELQVAGGGEYDVLLKSGERLRVTRLHRPALEQQLRRL